MTTITPSFDTRLEQAIAAERAASDAWLDALLSGSKDLVRLSSAHTAAYNTLYCLQQQQAAALGFALKGGVFVHPVTFALTPVKRECSCCRQSVYSLHRIPDAIADAVEEHEAWANEGDDDTGGFCEDCLDTWDELYNADRKRHWAYGGAR